MDGDILIHFTQRFGGVSKEPYESLNLAFHVDDERVHVEQNRAILCKKLGIENLVSMEQIHGDNVVVVDELRSHVVQACDGLITKRKNLALMVMVADCLPMILSSKSVVCALHVGRAGMDKNIVKKAICEFERLGVRVDEISVYIGAGIKQCCYELSEEVLEKMREKYPLHVRENHLSVDGVVLEQLKELGVKKIEIDSTCTSCDKRYFSYRRDGVTGRMAGVVMLRGEDE